MDFFRGFWDAIYGAGMWCSSHLYDLGHLAGGIFIVALLIALFLFLYYHLAVKKYDL